MSKEDAIAQLTTVFREYGYDGATLAKLSDATGLVKASLYHYFPKGKEEMAAAVLSHAGTCLQQTVLAPLKAAGEPRDRIQAMTAGVDAFYQSGHQACLTAVLSFGEAGHLFHDRIQRALTLWIDTLAQVLVEAGIDAKTARDRAEDALIQIQGALIVSRGLNDSTPFQRVLRRLPDDLLRD
jgi:TetR/AcrR family transcriptional regulator, lmrAB and yxaGH operons repressor